MKTFKKILFCISVITCISISAKAQNKISIDSLKKMISTADSSLTIKNIESIMENYIYKDESDYYLINTMLEIKKDEVFIKEKIRINSEEEIKNRLITFLKSGNSFIPGDSLLPVYVLSMLISDAMNNNYFFSIDAQNIIASHPVIDYLIKCSSDKELKDLYKDLKKVLAISSGNNYNYYGTDEYKKLAESFKISRSKIESIKNAKK